MTVSICRTYRFEAAHHLPMLPETHKCHRLHGHNYKVEMVRAAWMGTEMRQEPRFCAQCGLWEGEFMACEEPDCGPLMTKFELDILDDFETLLAEDKKP